MSAPPPDAPEVQNDPMVDPRRRAKSDDPGWKYGYWTVIGNRDKVTCNLCKGETSGGIKRLKEHLAGGYSDVAMCPKTTTEIRKEMREYLENNKRTRPIFLEEGEEGQQGEGEGQVEVVKPSSGTNAKKSRAFLRNFEFKFKAPAGPSQSTAKPKETTSIATKLRKTPEQIVDERNSGAYQPTIEAVMKTKAERDYVSKQWALWFYECGVPFNAVNSRQFQIACEATAQYGSGYVPPSFHELREPLLQECVKDTSKLREEHELAWQQYGCTLMSDGWTDRRGRHLINFLANSPEGTYFLGSVDASSEQHDATMIADLLEKRIDAIGRDKVVQVITDNGANYKAAGKILMERIPTLFWSPCAAHCLDLMLEDIGNLKQFKKPIAQAKRVTTFIYRHGRVLSMMRERTCGMDLVRPGATRFATCFLTLKSLHKHRDALRTLFGSEVWNGMKLAKTQAGGQVADIILSKDFWTLGVEDCLRASTPLLIVLRAVDGDEKPAMAEVAALMQHAKERIKLSFSTQNKQQLLGKILEIIEGRWVRQMDHPLYGAAFYLNPGKFFAIQKKGDARLISELRCCFNDVLARMEQDENVHQKIDEQAMQYEDQRGPIFVNKLAMQNMETKSPLDWWRSYGGRSFELQRFAKRVVSLCASSSGCERNWSTFEFMHTKKRNRLLHKRLNDLVFVSYNRKMKSRFQKRKDNPGKSYDPLVIEDFDWDNEWTDSTYVHTKGGRGCENDLTWDDVDEAVGASCSLRGRNLPRLAQIKTYGRRPRGAVLSNSDDEVEEEDPHDDEDVSESDEDATTGDEGNLDSTNNQDEFDDGF